MEETMKKSAFFITALAVILLSGTAISAEYNATGLWSYTELFPSHDCTFEYTLREGQVVIIQSDDEFAVVIIQFDNEFTIVSFETLVGTISEGKYTYSDTYYQHGGWIDVSADITFTSDRLGTGMATWTWKDISDPLNPKICSGLYHITVIRIVPEAPIYEATGPWKYSYSNFSNECEFSNPSNSGIFNITQNGNLITIVDDQSGQLLLPIVGYVDGPSYNFVKVYPRRNGTKDGITGELFSLALISNKNGSGDCIWKWINTKNSSDNCGGSWDITITAISNTIPSVPLLLLDE